MCCSRKSQKLYSENRHPCAVDAAASLSNTVRKEAKRGWEVRCGGWKSAGKQNRDRQTERRRRVDDTSKMNELSADLELKRIFKFQQKLQACPSDARIMLTTTAPWI